MIKEVMRVQPVVKKPMIEGAMAISFSNKDLKKKSSTATMTL